MHRPRCASLYIDSISPCVCAEIAQARLIRTLWYCDKIYFGITVYTVENCGERLKNIEKPFEHSLSPPQFWIFIYPYITVGDPYVDS